MRGEKRRKTNVEKEIGTALWWEKCKKLSLLLDTCHWVNATEEPKSHKNGEATDLLKEKGKLAY